MSISVLIEVFLLLLLSLFLNPASLTSQFSLSVITFSWSVQPIAVPLVAGDFISYFPEIMRLLKVNILDFSLFPPSHLQAVCIYTILSAKASPFTCAYKSILFSKPVFSNRTLCNDEIVLYFCCPKL